MKTVNSHFGFPLLKELLLLSVLLGMGSGVIGQTLKGQTNQSSGASFSMDLSYGDIKFTDATVTYYNSSGVLQTHNRTSGETYEITQNNNSTPTNHTISFGTQVTYNSNDWEAGCETGGTLVSVETVVYLAGINIELTDDADKNKAPIMVNNSANAVYLILKNGTTNNIKMECAGINHHAGIEKELWSPYNNASGHLVITCESGYANHDHSSHTGGHDCTEGGSCGILNVYGNKAYSEGYNNGDGGRIEAQGAAAIGAIAGAIVRDGDGLTSGYYDVDTHTGTPYRLMKNLVIAGGVIMAKAGAGYGASQSGAAGIGLGAGPLASVTGTGPGIENLCITGGRITAKGSSGSASNIGGSYRSNNVSINISGGYIDATERWRDGEGNNYGKGAGIGSGAGGTESGSVGRATINISGGTVYAKSHWGAAIGGASGGSGTNANYSYTSSSGATINISGGYVNAETTSTGAALGSGGLFAYSDWTGITGDASVTISGGTVIAKSAAGADIGTGGQVNVRDYTHAGDATVNFTGNNTFSVTANTGGIGGGKANGGNGGSATITINAPNATINTSSIGGGESVTGVGGNASVIVVAGNPTVTGTIGGGNSLVGHGGTATINIQGGTLEAATVGGGNSTSDGTIPADPEDPSAGYQPMTAGNGGNANVIVEGGTLNITEKIGGGKSYGTGAGGNASIYVTGGTLNCLSIGGGDSNLGAPGSVSAEIQDNPALPNYNPLGAGIYIAGDNKITVKSGYIGGGTNTAGDIGKATAYVNATHNESTIQGQFILCNNTSTTTDHCFFIMEAGTLDNTNLGAIGATSYPRMKTEGGAVYMEDLNGVVSINGGTVRNSKGTLGGAVYMTNGTFTLGGGTLYSNSATDKGGAVYLGGGTVTMNGGTIGGTALANGNTAANYGGGVYMAGGSLTMNGGSVQYNKATNKDGGGIYIADGGTLTAKGGTIQGNQAMNGNGGGFYVNPGSGETTTIKSDVANTSITGNTARNGGGAYVSSGKLYVASTNGNTTSICSNTATVNGGGCYASSDVEVVSGTVCDNSAVNGAGLYSASGNVEVKSNSSISGNTATADGGGIYAAGGHVTVNPSDVSVEVLTDNHADNGNGGAIYAGGGNVSFQNGTITGNSANNGGAIYANGGTVTFRDGIISSNHAQARGGGLYITESGNLSLQGTAVLTRNHVPSSGEGGGVYLAGVVYVGTEGGTAGSPKTDAIIAEDNFADDDPDAVINWSNRNNIFLPKPRVNTAHKDVITIYPYGMSLNSGSGTHSHVGFSVPRNFVPVIYCSDHNYLSANKDALVATVFDDSELYFTVWNNDLPYNKNYIYLSGLLWTEAVYQCPSTGFTVDADGNVTISTKEAFAWLISYVNGRTDDYPWPSNDMDGKKVTIALAEGENLDMHQYGWVPIGYGESGKEFKGEFEGNGNSISGIIVTFGNEQGVFGDVTGSAKISNVFISNTALSSMRYDTDTYYMGGLACKVGDNAEVVGCGANGPMDCLDLATGAVMGGLVGKLYGNAKIRSCYATPDMEGYTMGGLVGEMTGGTVENSFSYPKFTAYSASTAYIGGLAATMTGGKFKNCYTHELSGSSHGTGGKFGWFAGDYEAGEFNYCYAPENANFVHTGELGAASGEGYGWFAPTALVDGKYGFKHQDQDVMKTVESHTNNYIENGIVDENGNLKGLLATLNNWVEAQGSDASYANWMRTMGSHVNLDLPVLEYTKEACLGSETGAIVYSKDVNDLLGDFLDGDIYLYATNPTQISKSTKTNVRLYIAQNVGILQSASATLKARVGVLLDNSDGSYLGGKPYDWHMFSTPLSDAPLGLTYNPNGESYTPAYGIDPPQVDIQAGCYFPTNTPYGTPYTTSTGSFDFYCYHEPSSHWINLKRDSDDHWHQVEHTNITYTNESLLTPGKGYLLAVSYPTMVMADGTLTKGSFTSDVVKTEHPFYDSGLDGVNLVGNPYQSYLDFSAFAGDNGLTTYYILDADKHEYLPYTVGGTEGAETAPANLHPHQGFFVRVASTGTVQFKDSQRLSTGTVYSNFRGDRPKYPLVNLVCADGDGRNDCAIVELNRPDTGGGEKVIGLRAGDASLWVHYDDTDWHIAFMPEGIESVPVRFKAFEDGMYTLRWSTENADFGYLHLIDNMTGIDVDCLATDKYVFEGKTTDYISRFRLEFQCTGVEENDGNDNANVSFAYQMGDELIINGEGMLQLFDVNGRLLMSRETHGVQTSLSLPKVSAGVYVLRQTGIKGVRVQKMVIK